MEDPRLKHTGYKFHDYLWRVFEESDITRTYQPDVSNDMGVRWYVDEMRDVNKLVSFQNKMDGQFCWCETLTANISRFGLQWVDTFSGRVEAVARSGRVVSQSFAPIFAGGVISAGTLIGANFMAASNAWGQNGINLPHFWLMSQFYMLLATPVSALAEKLMHQNLSYEQGFWRALRPSRLAFNAAFALAIGTYNSSSEPVKLLYVPSLIVSGVLLRVANTPQILESMVGRQGGSLQLEGQNPLSFSRLAWAKGGSLSIAAFVALNYIFPITLPQALTGKQLEKGYFDYLKEVDSKQF